MRLLKLVPDDTNIKFLRWRFPFFIVSTLLILASWASLAVNGLNLGVDFVGGQMIRMTFTQTAEAPVAELREDVARLGYGEPIIQRYGQPNEVSLRMKLPAGSESNTALSDQMAQTITAAIRKAHPDVRIDGVDSVSGKVSGELYRTGMTALLAATIAIAIFIWVRFEWQFGVGALFALVHDVSLTLGFFSLTRLEFDLNIVAALLTIIGYSLNDTIVIYDRIRENLKKYRRMPMFELLDLSVNETLARTVMTSLSILITLVALLVLGPQVIFGFTLAITLGIFVGTYSSVYMSAPILVWLNVTSNSFVQSETAVEKQERAARAQG